MFADTKLTLWARRKRQHNHACLLTLILPKAARTSKPKEGHPHDIPFLQDRFAQDTLALHHSTEREGVRRQTGPGIWLCSVPAHCGCGNLAAREPLCELGRDRL